MTDTRQRAWPPLHDYRSSRAVLIGTWRYSSLPSLEAAKHSYRRMRRLLTGPLCGWPADRLLLMDNQSSASEVHDQLITAFGPVNDVALFYYVGHGQLEDDELCLALSGSRTEYTRRSATSLTFSAVRQALLNSDATTKIVILDCCFSGAATQPRNTLAAAAAVAHESLPSRVAEQVYGTGAYTMVAAGAYGTAQYETDSPHPETYFTKYLADLVERGMPGQPASLRLEPLFQQLRD
ncbi:MAG: caspase, EACC1-associated type, partial [Streptosporangiaceae bacterium]